ncbi:YebC/PmpR family DNA-binding transcriptional regulator [Candidatus Berkelbacteria bacterium]|nr:YebC/PmpR family DNA-binding transcriptional regulator [Candidatus Berkelbacteria bacterium]
MSGHSKWAQIKRKKGATDVKRGQRFSKLSKQLTIAARLGKNLDMAVAAARAANMAKDTIDRAIAKGTGAGADSVQIEEALYEAFGPGGTAILISVLTDNKNRTMGELRTLAGKQGFTLANSGAVRHLFEYYGILEVPAGPDPDATQLALIDLGAADVATEDEVIVGYFSPTSLDQARKAAETAGLTVQSIRLGYVPKVQQTISAEEQEKLVHILERIDELDDVDSVETNAAL